MSFQITPKTFFLFSRILSSAAIAGAIFLTIDVLFFDPLTSSHSHQEDVSLPQSPIQEKAFQSFNDAISQLGSPSSFLTLSPIQVTYRLPDLRSHILYHGMNRRPDAPLSTAKMTISMRADPSTAISVSSEEKIPIIYEIRQGTGRWLISPQFIADKNAPLAGPLTVSILPQESSGLITVDFNAPQGHEASIDAPREFKQFSAPVTPIPTVQAEIQKWRLGDYTVDPTLLERQKIVWYGQDSVMEMLGDEEWEYQRSRQRVQFGADRDAYLIWVKEGDCFVFEDGKWVAQDPGPNTLGKPLLVASNISDKAIQWTLWNEDGTIHYPLQTIRREPVAQQGKEKSPIDIKIVGAKSKSRWIMEINGKRLIIQPTDWLIATENGNTILIIDSPALLGDYLEGKINGTLIAFQRIEKHGSDQCLVGTVFDPTRTISQPIEISLYRSWEKNSSSKSSSSGKKQSQIDDDDDDDDDDFFDDDDDDESDLDTTKDTGRNDDLFQDDFDDE